MANDEVPHPGHVKEGRGGVEGPRSGGLVQWVSYSLRSELVCLYIITINDFARYSNSIQIPPAGLCVSLAP